MHKKFLMTLLSLTTACCMLFGMAACGGAKDKAEKEKDEPIEEPDIVIPDAEDGKKDEAQDKEQDGNENDNEIPGGEKEDDKKYVESKALKFYFGSEDEDRYFVDLIVDICPRDDIYIAVPAEHEGLPVTAIGVDGFMRSKVWGVRLPDTITTIHNRAFFDCNSLSEINLPNSITEIHWRAFASTGFESIVLPESLTVIESEVFYSCFALKEVTIPASVTEVWSGAFRGCNYLKDINYLGTMSEWESIEKGNYWDCDEEYSTEVFDWVPVPRSYTVHCTDGDIAIN